MKIYELCLAELCDFFPCVLIGLCDFIFGDSLSARESYEALTLLLRGAGERDCLMIWGHLAPVFQVFP